MTPGQILWAVKIGAVGVFLALVFTAGHRMGAKGVQRDWDDSKLEILEQRANLIAENAEKIARTVEKHQQINLDVSKDHERALHAIREKYDADVAAARASGGLRVSRSICNGPTTTGTETASAVRIDEAATIQLPAKVEERLYKLAQDADETAAQLTALQKWIVVSGFHQKGE